MSRTPCFNRERAAASTHLRLTYSLNLMAVPLTLPSHQYRQVALHYQESLATLQRIGDPLLLTENLVLCAYTAIHLGEYDRAEAYLHESQQISQDFVLPIGLLSTHLCLGELYRVRGQYSEAKASCIASLHRYTEITDDRGITVVLRILGLIAYAGHAYAEAKQYLQESLRLAQHSGCQEAVVMALTALSHLYLQLGEEQQARTMQQKSYTLAQQLPQREDLLAIALGGLADVDTFLDAHAAAETNYQQALTIAVRVEAPPLILELLVGLAALRFKTGSATSAQIAQWLALPCHHPAGAHATKERAAQLLADMTITAPSTAHPSIPVNGPVDDWPATIAAILDSDDRRLVPVASFPG